jgi:hypothetical protein
MSISVDKLTKLTTSGLGISGLLFSQLKKDSFQDTQELDKSTLITVIVLAVLVIIAYILLAISIYRVTNGSVIQTIIFIFFGFLYLWVALIAYGFSGYKLTKMK